MNSSINRNEFAIKIYYYDDSPRFPCRFTWPGRKHLRNKRCFKGSPAVKDKQRSLENGQFSKKKKAFNKFVVQNHSTD